MNKVLIALMALTAVVTMVGADLADARRLGGGRSFGAQRQSTPPSAANTAPSSSMPSVAGKSGAAATGAATAGTSRWLGPLAGLAAGLGIAALLSHLGLSEAFAGVLMLALLVGGGILLLRMLMPRRQQPSGPLQYTGADPAQVRVEPRINRPASRFEPVMGGMATAPAASGTRPRFAPGFDPAPFAEQAKHQFRRLQAAYDKADRRALSEVMTPEMFAEVTQELAQRGSHTPTEVVRLDADVLEATTEADRHWVSVRFTGALREDGAVLPKDFDEIWNLTKPVDDSTGWLLAGMQQTNELA
ncbi:MAG: Tim44 domain-containing protein [Burkholderiales bacterium]|nr:Tim44 domain-containing protein [Burkholderiales bacterium]